MEQNPEYLRAVGDVAKFLESRASQRFFEVIGNATGLLPLAIRKRAEAEAKALILLSEAEARGIVEKPKAEKDAAIIRAEEGVEVSVIKAEGGVDVRDIRTRAKIRAEVETVREQRNIESIAGMALLDMPSEVGDDSPNEDWIYSFFGYARGVSNPQMQFVWSKILSGEIRTPGSFSLLTLETMRTIQKREADLFTKACRCLFEINGVPTIITKFNFFRHDQGSPDQDISIPMSEADLIHLESYNLLSVDEFYRNFYQGSAEIKNSGSEDTLEYFGTRYTISWNENTRKDKMYQNIILNCASLSIVGKELYPISGATPDRDFERNLVKCLRNTMHLSLSTTKQK